LKRILLAAIALLLATIVCGQVAPTSTPLPQPAQSPTLVDRYTLMPGTKITPAEDFWPPSIARAGAGLSLSPIPSAPPEGRTVPHDPVGQINPAFLSVSLRHNDGAPKPALTVWQEMIHKSI